MIKTLAASSVAKAAALCICPVVGAGVVATKVPQVRKYIHKATAPAKPVRRARSLPAAVERPCVPAPQVASVVPPAVPRVAQILPQAAELPTPEIATVPGAASTAPGSTGTTTAVGPTPVVFGGGGGFFGGGIGGGGGGFIIPAPIVPGDTVPPVTPPGGTVPAIPEPQMWMQMLGGFMVIGGAMRAGRHYRRGSTRVA